TILVNSLFSRESVLRAYGLESRVCYLGVDSDKFKPTGEKRADFVIGLGGIDYLKGVDRAIRGLGALPASKRPELVWVSNFENVGTQSELEALARSCEVEFKLLVGVTEAELSSLLSRARMLLYTSRLEPFGYAPLEVNACGTPVVAIAEGGIRETVRDEVNGLLVRSAEPAALAAAVERLIDDPQLAQRLGNVGMHEVRERWTIEAGIDNIEHELLQLVERKRARCSL
ncbi:MAG: glycosyltransferase family 4 protein, partial [Chthoniobacterales bacterium]